MRSPPGEKVAVVGLAGWDDEMVKEVDGEGNVSLWVPANLSATASRIFRIGDRLFQVPNSGEGAKVQSLDDVSNLDDYKPKTGDDMRITDVEIDWNNRVLHMVIEVENGEERSSDSPTSPTISDLVRLRRSSTLPFGDDAEDFDISRAKMPFVEEGAEEPTPNKYNIDLKLPNDASSGFYRLEW